MEVKLSRADYEKMLDHARKELGSYSVLAGDLLKMLGRTLKELEDMTE